MNGPTIVWKLARVGVTVEVPMGKAKELRADIADALRELDRYEPKPISDKPVKCAVCGKSLPSRRSIGGHMRSHTREYTAEDFAPEQEAIHVPEDPEGAVIQDGFSESD